MTDSTTNHLRKQGTRVFKKSSPNGKITTYLYKRDFIDSLTHVDPIEGVVLVDPEYVRGRKVFTHVLSAFRYGREDLDVLGLTFRKDLYLASAQIYPPIYSESSEHGKVLLNPPITIATGVNKSTNTISQPDSNVTTDEQTNSLPLTKLQERLIKKLGANAYPFYFKLPPDAPASVTLQPGPNESGKPCGVDYELRTYVADTSDDKLQKRNSVRLAIRKLTYAPEEPAPQPSAVIVKEFLMSPGALRLEVSLDKEKYYHGESIEVNVLVDNNSNKTVKRIKLSVRQYTQLCLYHNNRYSCVVDELESDESFPILPSQTGWCKVYRLCPLLANNRHKRGLALDGKLKHEDTNLASSTIICNQHQRENLGMTVQYRVKVRFVLGFGSSDVCLGLPFTLTHPKPEPDASVDNLIDEDEELVSNTATQGATPLSSSIQQRDGTSQSGQFPSDVQVSQTHHRHNVDNLIDLGAEAALSKFKTTNIEDDDDLVFEDFARLRLKAYENENVQTTVQQGHGDIPYPSIEK